MFRNYFLLRLMLCGISLIILTIHLKGQETNSRASGKVISDGNEIPAGVTVTLIHEPTQNKYVAVSQNKGYFYFFDVKPGGPYTIIFSSAGYETFKKNPAVYYGSYLLCRPLSKILFALSVSFFYYSI